MFGDPAWEVGPKRDPFRDTPYETEPRPDPFGSSSTSIVSRPEPFTGSSSVIVPRGDPFGDSTPVIDITPGSHSAVTSWPNPFGSIPSGVVPSFDPFHGFPSGTGTRPDSFGGIPSSSTNPFGGSSWSARFPGNVEVNGYFEETEYKDIHSTTIRRKCFFNARPKASIGGSSNAYNLTHSTSTSLRGEGNYDGVCFPRTSAFPDETFVSKIAHCERLILDDHRTNLNGIIEVDTFVFGKALEMYHLSPLELRLQYYENNMDTSTLESSSVVETAPKDSFGFDLKPESHNISVEELRLVTYNDKKVKNSFANV